MKVLIVASRARSLVNFRGALISDMVRRGIEVHCASPADDRDEEVLGDLARIGAIFHRVPMARGSTNVIRDLWTFVRLLFLFIVVRPDCVLTYTAKPVIYGTLAASACRVGRRVALITGLGYGFSSLGSRRLKAVITNLYRVSLRFAHLVVFQNRDDLRHFQEDKVIRTRMPTLVVGGSGIDLEKFALADPHSGLSFLFIGRLLVSKGIREFLRAAQLVKRNHPGVEFLVAGWFDDVPDAISTEELSEYTRSGAITYLGQLSDVRSALRSCSVFVLPSYREGMPRTVLEAMAVGRAIITTDAPGCRETVVSGVNGYLVDIGDVDSLVAAMLKFIRDPDQAAVMGRRSRELAEEKFDVRKVNRAMLSAMEIGSH